MPSMAFPISCYRTVCAEYLISANGSRSDDDKVWIIDRTMAKYFVRAVDALAPRPLSVEAVYGVYEQRELDSLLAHHSCKDGQQEIARYMGFLLTAVQDKDASTDLYLLDVDKVLHFLSRTTFSWTVFYSDERDYEAGRAAILAHLGSQAEKDEAMSVTASIVLEQNQVFGESQLSPIKYTPRTVVATPSELPPECNSTKSMEAEGQRVSPASSQTESDNAWPDVPEQMLEKAPSTTHVTLPIQAESFQSEVTSPTNSSNKDKEFLCKLGVEPPKENQGDGEEGYAATATSLEDFLERFRSNTPWRQDEVQQEAFDVAAELEAAVMRGTPRNQASLEEQERAQRREDVNAFQASSSKGQKYTSFPRPQVQIKDFEARQDVRAAHAILTKVKVLALDMSPPFVRRYRTCPYSLRGEKHAIFSMSAAYTLNIGSDTDVATDFSNSHNEALLDFRGIVKRLFERFDAANLFYQPKVPGTWSKSSATQADKCAEHGFLLLILRLLRHHFMYRTRKRRAGENYASDFDALLPVTLPETRPAVFAHDQRLNARKSSTSMCRSGCPLWRRAGALCRIVVACDHPCVVLVLARLAARLHIRLTTLLDELPLQQFCHWAATGSASQTHLQPEKTMPRDHNGNPSLSAMAAVAASAKVEQLEQDLRWAHENIWLPLLAVAAQRVPSSFYALDGRLRCSVEACLHAIVPHTKQTKYADFVAGLLHDPHWEHGRVLLEGNARSDSYDDDERDDMTPQFSIPKRHRTFAAFDVAEFEPICDKDFDPPPAFLLNRVLEMRGLD